MNHDVRPPVVVPLGHRELVYRQPVVGAHCAEIQQAHVVTRNAAIGAGVFHRHTVTQHAVESAVGLGE